MKKLIVISLVLVIIFVIVSKGELYTGLFAKFTDVLSKGFSLLTSGKTV